MPRSQPHHPTQPRPPQTRATDVPRNERSAPRGARRRQQEISVILSPPAPPALGEPRYVFLGLLLLPITSITLLTFFSSFAQATWHHRWLVSAPAWFFALGLILWTGFFFSGLRGRYLYVLGHEYTHALFILLCRGRVYRIKISRSGGQVLTDKNNWLIALSPYFVPFWPLVVTACYGLGWTVMDLGRTYEGFFFGLADFRWDWLLFLALGLTMGLHLTFTAWMVVKDQPDLQYHGPFLSLIIISLANLLLLSALLVAAVPQIGWGDYFAHWWHHAGSLWSLVAQPLRQLW
jgi:hypothetical protein